jgi:MFS family permease
MLAVGDNSTAIMAALPEMRGSPQLDRTEVEWVVNAYLLTAAIFIIVDGGAADQLGARRSSVAGMFALLMPGLFVAGAGIALIYASSPRLGLATLPQLQAGKGSGLLYSCSFLGGTVGVTFGGIVFALAGFSGVLVLLGISALTSAVLCLRLRVD